MQIGPGLKALGLSALVMSVMAVGAADVAHAEEGACWGYINSSTGELDCFSTSLAPKTAISIENNTGTLLVENLNFETLCTGVTIIESGAITGNAILGRGEFSGCVSLTRTPTLSILPACTPVDPVAGPGKIRSEKVIGLIVLHNGEPVVEIKPDVEGGALAKIFRGEECAIGEEVIVSGKVFLHDAGGKTSFEEHKLTHLAEEFSGLQLMRIGVNKATIDGTGTIALTSPHNALEWGGHAG